MLKDVMSESRMGVGNVYCANLRGLSLGIRYLYHW